MNLRTIKKEFKERNIDCEIEKCNDIKRFINEPVYTLRTKESITTFGNNNGGRLVRIETIADIDRIEKQYKNGEF